MISAIMNQGRLNFMVFKGRFTATVSLEFLNRLLGQSTPKVFLIVDRLRSIVPKKRSNGWKNIVKKFAYFFSPAIVRNYLS